ncbi:midasin [Striga asiatica]|uniref:Midasin n=1 Tax=Striga asiatica TaxID=4170 RepID=A0A5A7QFY5_STRAF|nr:midasin [Striga asiatica]
MKKKPVQKSNPILKLARGLRVSDCEIQIRPSDKECSPASRYSSTSKFFTVTLEFGGKFDIGKKYSAYLGGSTILFDYVDYEMVTLADFKSVAEFKGCKNPMRLHTYVGCGSFMLLSTETDLESVWQRQIKKVREVSLFVEELKIVNAPEIENEVGEDDSDETFEWENDSEVDKLDDILFDENVDEVEVEVGVEAEEGEVEGEGDEGEGEKGEGEGETELGVEKGELGVEIEAEKVDEGEESDEDLNQVVDEVAEFMAKNGGFDADGGVGGESEESEDSEESDDDIFGLGV